jgi:hypothetical protein
LLFLKPGAWPEHLQDCQGGSLSAWEIHKFWLIRAAAVLLLTVLAAVLAVLLAPRPIPWVALIAGSLPITMALFVALPVLRAEEGRR